MVVLITAILFGLTLTPITQMKTLESNTGFLRDIELAHQLAMQKARNAEQLKNYLANTPPATPPFAGSAIDRCFGGRGSNCNTFSRNQVEMLADSLTHKVTGAAGYEVSNRTLITVICDAIKCSEVHLDVITEPGAGSSGPHAGRRYQERVTFPASVISSRQEIDFSACSGKIITGIDYATLTAQCIEPVGQDTCEGIASNTGPMLVFGQPVDPSNCQQPADTTCPNGMAAVGMMNGQPMCVANPTCNDPFSAGCSPPPCTSDWSPLPNTICSGDLFVQTDLNACDPMNTTRNQVGTMLPCPTTSCNYNGSVKWPNPATGACGNNTVNITNTPPASNTINNATIGYTGTMAVTCVDLSPAPNAFDFASATNTCQPVTCSGVSGTVEWSANGIKSAVAGPGLDPVGPWPCKGNVSITQAGSYGPGLLAVTQADATATASATHTPDANAVAGSINLYCNDPGPATNNSRVGEIVVSSFSCVTPPPTAKCSGGASGILSVGGTVGCDSYFVPDTNPANNNVGTCTTTIVDNLKADEYCTEVTNEDPVFGYMCNVVWFTACAKDPPKYCWSLNGYDTTNSFKDANWDCTNQYAQAGSCTALTDTKPLGQCVNRLTGALAPHSTLTQFSCIESDPIKCWTPTAPVFNPIQCENSFSENCAVGSTCNTPSWSNFQDWWETQLKALGFVDPKTTFNAQFNNMVSAYNTSVSGANNTGFGSQSRSYSFGPYSFNYSNDWVGNVGSLPPGTFDITSFGAFSGTHPVTGQNICNSCTISSWMPNVNAADICVGKSVQQTSNCGSKQTINGTKTPDWRLEPGKTPMDPATWIEADHFTTETATFTDINSCSTPNTITKTGTKPPAALCWSRNPAWDANFVFPAICSLNGACATSGNSTNTKCLDTVGNMTTTQVACYSAAMNECVYGPGDECIIPYSTQSDCENVHSTCKFDGSKWKKDCGGPPVTLYWGASSPTAAPMECIPFGSPPLGSYFGNLCHNPGTVVCSPAGTIRNCYQHGGTGGPCGSSEHVFYPRTQTCGP